MDRLTSRAKPLADAAQRLLRPTQVRTNQDTGLIKLLACLCMLIDHAGKMLFPNVPEMRLIGRLAFPLFAYGIAVGAVYTKDPMRYLTRIVLLALISQPLYALGLAHETSAMYAVSFFDNPIYSAINFYLSSWSKPNILLSLALGLCIMICLRQKRYVLAVGLYVLCHRFSAQLDYGIQGIHLMLLFYLLCEHPIANLAACSAFMIWWSKGFGYTFFGFEFGMRIFALPAVIFACIPMKRRVMLPKRFIYGFYPAHLAALAVLCRIF